MKKTLVMTFCLLLGAGCGVSEVARKEFSARTLLDRYEWFKDAAAALDAKLASLEVYKARRKALADGYAGKTRSEWAREDREQANLWEQEVAGLKSSYNRLASEYNAAMAKENFRFTNQGRLPEGASKPLPREYKPYLED